MFGLEILAKLFKILRSDATPNQIAIGFVIGMFLGLTPIFTFHNLILIALLIILKVNIGMALFGFALFSGVAYLLDPVFHSLGYYLLVEVGALQPLWKLLMDMPFIALSRYNNTVVAGGLAFSKLMIIPVFFFMRWFVIYYRKNLDPKFQKFKIVQVVKSSKFYSIYEKIKGIGG